MLAQAIRQMHTDKLGAIDMESFLIHITEPFREKSDIVVHIFKDETKRCEIKLNMTSPVIRIHPCLVEDVLKELIIQGFFVYTDDNSDFVVSLYHYPSAHFGGILINPGNSELKY